MSFKTRVLAIAGTAALATGLTATAAFAGTPTSGPTVGPTHDFGVKPPVVRTVSHPEQFDIQVSHIAGFGTFGGINVDRLVAQGPFATNNGSDVTLSNTLDRFQRPGGSIRVNHTGLGTPTVNATTCTVTYDQTGVWNVVAHSGLGNAANIVSGSGTFRLMALFSVPTRNGHCALSGLTVANAAAYAQSHSNFNDVAVQGTGNIATTLPVKPVHYYVH
jgi:hypothetical protein